MNLKIKSTPVIFTSLFVIGLFASPTIFVESYALPVHNTFDIASQPYCFVEDADFNLIPVDGITNQEQTIKSMLNQAAAHISNETIMRFIELGCYADTGIFIDIISLDTDLDAIVDESPEFSPNFDFKITFPAIFVPLSEQ